MTREELRDLLDDYRDAVAHTVECAHTDDSVLSAAITSELDVRFNIDAALIDLFKKVQA